MPRNVRRCARDMPENLASARVLVRRDGLMIGQPAHAWVSGQLARAWGNDGVPGARAARAVLPRRRAARRRLGRRRPRPDARRRGAAAELHAVPRPAHVAIWRGAARRMLAQSRHAALLVSLHGTSLYDRYVDADAHPPEVAAAIRDYLARERALQAELARGLDPGVVDRGRRLLLALDRLSLALCHGDATGSTTCPAAARRARRSASRRPARAAGAAEAARATTRGRARARRPRASPSTLAVRGAGGRRRLRGPARRRARSPTTRRCAPPSPPRPGCRCAGRSAQRDPEQIEEAVGGARVDPVRSR